ncbi:hypothetical protein HPG69_004140 [Diceros bicornis minor]|uniref:C-type lectin domain-containing protein n=1 Tax=Diceros bicornis minor TaxID=77932 RepID=A0A7J7E9F8_DICBM|nr:hypothetical protein HPG69_004140 [Diceros bicornis minor]
MEILRYALNNIMKLVCTQIGFPHQLKDAEDVGTHLNTLTQTSDTWIYDYLSGEVINHITRLQLFFTIGTRNHPEGSIMSNASDCEQSPETTEQRETIPIVNLEPTLALPPPPPPEDEGGPIPERTNMDDFQSVQSSESKLKSLNHWIESFQNKEETFLQVQKVLGENKETLEWLRNQNEYLIEALQELTAKQGDRCGPPLTHWVQYRDHCYHQTTEMVSWLNCSDLCVSLNATFLKTERSRLMSIMKLLTASSTWLGLSYKEENNERKWVDSSLPSPGLHLPEPSLDFQGKCVYVNAHTVGTDNCTRSSSCLCEKAVH